MFVLGQLADSTCCVKLAFDVPVLLPCIIFLPTYSHTHRSKKVDSGTFQWEKHFNQVTPTVSADSKFPRPYKQYSCITTKPKTSTLTYRSAPEIILLIINMQTVMTTDP